MRSMVAPGVFEKIFFANYHPPAIRNNAMPERLLSPLAYLVVLVVLMLMTILTVGLSFVPSTGLMHIVAGQAIAVFKASLVVLFFMHALHSTAQTRAVIVVTIFWLVVVMSLLMFSDYFTRGMIPSMPGH
jgi:cytochrome c oxidase subunit IV